MPADSLHVTQMKGFTPPPSEQPLTVWHMQAAADKAAEKAAKKEQSSPDAADAEQEN